MFKLSPTTARNLKLGTVTFIVAVVATVIFSLPDAGAAVQKPAAETPTAFGPNDSTIVTVSSSPASNPATKR